MAADPRRTPEDDDAFAEVAKSGGQQSFRAELWDYLRQTRKWWLTPILIVMVLIGVLLLVSSTPLSPFVYTLF
ncbi:MAG: hypothetical protein H6744_05545 [Deltaproteobacteria bacterium]|nr:hypothetical protein [Deltaproteobacteria bacterium]MCB9786143.1 hypothetical protein [Deltaproteobacteria bacterium]